jgi:hypothetical protein
MAGIDGFTAVKAFGLAVVLIAVNPKNLLLSLGAGSSLAQLGVSTSQAVVSLLVFVVVASTTIAGPLVYYLARGERAGKQLDAAKGLARDPQRGGDDGAVRRARRRSHLEGPPAARELSLRTGNTT